MVFNGVWVGLGHVGARSHRKDRASTGLFLFIRNLGQEMGTWENGTEGMAFARNTRLIYHPPPPPTSFPSPPLSLTEHQHSLPGGHEEHGDEGHEMDEAFGRVAHVGG